MNEMDLMRAMGDANEDYLRQAQNAAVQKTRRFLPRAALIAAAIALLSICVYAASAGIEYWFGQQIREDGTLDYHTISYRYPMEKVTIRQEAYDELNGYLNDNWEELLGELQQWGWPKSGDYVSVGLNAEELEFTSIAEVEKYLGIDLMTSPALDKAIAEHMERYGSYISFTLESGTTEETLKEYESTGFITLQGITLWIGTGKPEITNADSSYSIHIALTEDYADNYMDRVYAVYNEPLTVKPYVIGNQEVLLGTNDPGDDRTDTCMVLFAENGIGYCLHATADPISPAPVVYHGGTFDSAKDVLMPYLEDLG